MEMRHNYDSQITRRTISWKALSCNIQIPLHAGQWEAQWTVEKGYDDDSDSSEADKNENTEEDEERDKKATVVLVLQGPVTFKYVFH